MCNKKLKFSLFALLIFSCVLVSNVFAKSKNTTIYVNNTKVEGSAFTENGATYVPIRFVSDKFGYSTDYKVEERYGIPGPVVTIKSPSGRVMEIDDRGIRTNDGIDYAYYLGYTSNIGVGFWVNKGDRIYIPIRILANAYNLEISWEGNTNSVNLSTSQKERKVPMFGSFYNGVKLVDVNLNMNLIWQNGEYQVEGLNKSIAYLTDIYDANYNLKKLSPEAEKFKNSFKNKDMYMNNHYDMTYDGSKVVSHAYD